MFGKEGEEWTADMNYFTGKNNGVSNYTSSYYNSSNQILSKEIQQVLNGGNDKNFILQTDYTKPLGNGAKFETGLRAALRSRVNNNNTYLQYNSGQYVLVPSATSNYKNTDNVYAAYATYSGNLKDFGYKLGLRAESSNYAGELTNTGEQFKNTYPVSLFPSVFLTQKLPSNQQLQLSYSRRINRPNFFQLIPFVDYTDKLNITKGNPGLVP